LVGFVYYKGDGRVGEGKGEGEARKQGSEEARERKERGVEGERDRETEDDFHLTFPYSISYSFAKNEFCVIAP
jgi:hypothetical protein